MSLEIEINGSAAESGRYVSYAPSPCRIRSSETGADLPVTLRSEAAQSDGGEIVFYASGDAEPGLTLDLVLPGDGAWVKFQVAGRFGFPSAEDGDCHLVVEGAGSPSVVPLMVRVRKNANDLLPAERDRFLAALGAVNAAGTGVYQDFRDMHVDAADGEEHRGPHFLPWHRTYLLDLERELQAVDPTVSLHYWRFDQPASRLFRSDFLGATRQTTSTELVVFDPGHPLGSWVTDDTPGILRSARFDTQTSPAPGVPGFPVLSEAQTLALGDVYLDFLRMEGSPHGAAHVSFEGSIASIGTAPKDPLFFLLHSNVDRLWSLWQWLNRRVDPDDTDTYVEQNRDGRRLDDTLWPWNNVTGGSRPGFAPRGVKGLAASPTTPAPGARPTIRDTVDYHGQASAEARIGYSYDSVPYEFE